MRPGSILMRRPIPRSSSALVLLRPKDHTLLIARARQLGAQRRWQDAAAVTARQNQIEPGNDYSWLHEVSMWAYSGNTAEYRRACRAMLEQYRSTTSTWFAQRTIACCILEPGTLPDLAVLEPLRAVVANAQATNVTGGSWTVLALGFHDYRLGRLASAIERLATISGDTDSVRTRVPCRALACVSEALAHLRLGQSDQARRLLADAAALEREHGFDPEHAGPLPIHFWNDWLRYHVLLREAEGLLLDAAFPDDVFAP